MFNCSRVWRRMVSAAVAAPKKPRHGHSSRSSATVDVTKRRPHHQHSSSSISRPVAGSRRRADWVQQGKQQNPNKAGEGHKPGQKGKRSAPKNKNHAMPNQHNWKKQQRQRSNAHQNSKPTKNVAPSRSSGAKNKISSKRKRKPSSTSAAMPTPKQPQPEVTHLDDLAITSKRRLKLCLGTGNWENALKILPLTIAKSATFFAMKGEYDTIEKTMELCSKHHRWDEVVYVYELSCQIGTVPTYKAHKMAQYASARITGTARPSLRSEKAMKMLEHSLGIAPFEEYDGDEIVFQGARERRRDEKPAEAKDDSLLVEDTVTTPEASTLPPQPAASKTPQEELLRIQHRELQRMENTLLDGLTPSNAISRLRGLARNHANAVGGTLWNGAAALGGLTPADMAANLPFPLFHELTRVCLDAKEDFQSTDRSLLNSPSSADGEAPPAAVSCPLAVEYAEDTLLFHNVLISQNGKRLPTAGDTDCLPQDAEEHLNIIGRCGLRILVPDAHYINHAFPKLVQQSENAIVVITWSTLCEVLARARVDPKMKHIVEELLAASNMCKGVFGFPMKTKSGNRCSSTDTPTIQAGLERKLPLNGVQILGLSTEVLLSAYTFEVLRETVSGADPHDPQTRLVALSRYLMDDIAPQPPLQEEQQSYLLGDVSVSVLSKTPSARKLAYKLGVLKL